jgi:hypothetical protein
MPKVLEQRKETKLYWLHNPCQLNGYYLKNVLCQSKRTYRYKTGIYPTGKTKVLEINNWKQTVGLYRDIHQFRDHKLRSNLLKDENGNLVVYIHNILNRCKIYFS